MHVYIMVIVIRHYWISQTQATKDIAIKHAHIVSFLKNLYWLPVKQRINFLKSLHWFIVPWTLSS